MCVCPIAGGVVDILKHVKNLSLGLQTVNVLPWELNEKCTSALEYLSVLSADLRAGKVDRMMASGDKQVPALEFLKEHADELKRCKFSMPGKDGTTIVTIDLAASEASQGRDLRSMWAAEGQRASELDGPAAYALALQCLADFCDALCGVKLDPEWRPTRLRSLALRVLRKMRIVLRCIANSARHGARVYILA